MFLKPAKNTLLALYGRSKAVRGLRKVHRKPSCRALHWSCECQLNCQGCPSLFTEPLAMPSMCAYRQESMTSMQKHCSDSYQQCGRPYSLVMESVVKSQPTYGNIMANMRLIFSFLLQVASDGYCSSKQLWDAEGKQSGF